MTDYYCEACGGELVPLGRLGRRIHLRCRDCGLDQSADCECRGPDPADPCGHSATSMGCPVHDPFAYVYYPPEG